MMKLHLFNPEHDIALAAHLAHFTPPHAARQLKADLCWLPALWAGEDDAVLVTNAEYARKSYARRCKLLGRKMPLFVERAQLSQLPITQVAPWGWDAAVATDLQRWGVAADVMPDAAQLERYRQLSHRRTSAQLLPSLRIDGTVGEAMECSSIQEVEECRQRWDKIVIKSPWSSSGRGVHFSIQEGWINNVIKQQGSVMVEPYYNKVKDFGMEFERDATGKVRYLGLSLFHTKNGAYIGNLLATEEAKREQMARYLPLELLDEVRQRIIDNVQLGDYQGPFGIDMMIVQPSTFNVQRSTFNLHPCVELNLRRTMGHVALSLTPTDDDILKVMRIALTDHYKLHIRKAQ
jgi:hypothetical protein